MSGRHRTRSRYRLVRRLLVATVPVITAGGLAAAVVLGGGALATPSVDPEAAPAASIRSAPVGSTVPGWLREPAARGPLADVVGDAAAAAREQQEQREQRAEEQAQEREQEQDRSAGGECDLEGPPRFDDPAHPNEITNRDCGYVDGQGRERSQDPWIDGQLLSSYGE